jgi:uncharacterized protein YfaS (alpha-2-macroglobulin family)
MNDALSAKPQAGRRRFFLTVFVFAIANLGVWLAYYHYFGPQRQHLLRIDRFTPGDQATVGARPVFEWQFNLDVAPDTNPPAIIQPVLAGKWQWRGRRNLVFQPDRDLPKATRYTLTIPADRIRTPEGFALSAPFIATIGTTPLRVIGVRQGGFLDDRRYIIEFEFDDSVIPADLVSKLTLKGPDGAPLGFKLHGEAAGKIIRILTDPVNAPPQARVDSTDITVHLQAGLAGIGGPIGLIDPYEKKVSVGSTLAARDISANANGRGRPGISLQFNGAPDLALLRSVLSVDPPVKFVIKQNYQGVNLEGDFQPGNRYAIKISAAPKGADLRLYPRPDVLSVFVPDRSPAVWFQNEGGYLGSKGNRTLLAHAVNLSALRVNLWRVYDGNLVEWRNSAGNYRWQNDARAFAKPIASRIIQVKSDKNIVQDVHISLDDLLPMNVSNDGVFRVGLSPVSYTDEEANSHLNDYDAASALVTLSDIALSAKREEHGLTVWATSLSTAKPLDRIRVRVYSSKNQLLGEHLTNTDGLARITNLRMAEGETVAVLLADQLSNTAATQATSKPAAPSNRSLTWMDLRTTGWDLSDTDTSGKSYRRTGHDAFVYADRGAFRPGDTVHLRAIVRRNDGGAQQPMPARWLIRRPDFREWKQIMVTVDTDGSAALDLPLPDDLTTGRWTAELGLPGASSATSTFGSANFLVEEFMPNRLKISAGFGGKSIDPANKTRATLGEEPLRAVVQADYLFGRPASGLQATLSARLDPSSFAPADWKDYTFGDTGNLLDADATKAAGAITVSSKTSELKDLSAHALNESGHAEWPLQLKQLIPAPLKQSPTDPAPRDRYRGPWRLSIESSVQENGGRAVSAADNIQVDALPWYTGVRAASTTAAPGAPMSFEIALVTPHGKLASQDSSLEISLLTEGYNNSMTYRDGRYFYDSHRVLERVAKSDRHIKTTAGRAKVEVIPPASGPYILRIRDTQTGGITSLRFFASDGSPWQDNISREHPEKLEIVILPPDRAATATTQPAAKTAGHSDPLMKIGQRARVLIRSPFPGRLLFTVETDHVLTTRVIEMPASTVELPLEVTAALRPSAFITASVIRAIDPALKWRTHRAYGAARLCVDPADQKLAIDILTPTEVRPASTLDFSLRVTDSAGRPVANAPVTLAAVDQGILDLTSFHTPNPLAFFHAKRASGVQSLDIFSQLMPEVTKADKVSAIGGDGPAPDTGRHRSPVTARRVRPVALFVSLRTNDQGIATTHLSIPEFAGQLRFMAVAHSSNHFGSSDKPVFVRSPILVQSTFPRFAAPGDRFNVPVTLFNNSKAPTDVTLSAEWLPATPAAPIAFANSPDRRLALAAVTIPAGKQQVLTLPCIAGDGTGVARIRLTATAGAESCTETTEFPIRAPSPSITQGGFAVVGPDHPESLTFKDDFIPGTEQAAVTLSPMPSLQLPRALDYLERYPYGCCEQTISTCFPLLYLSEIGPRIAPGVFEKERIADKVQAGISRLLGMQTADGGLSMWPGSRDSWSWVSVYAAHFLIEARAAGHSIPPDFQKRLMNYVRALLDRPGDDDDLLECQAYASYILALSGKPDRAFMSRLAELTRPSAKPGDPAAIRAQARLYLSLAWLAAGRRDLAADLFPASLPPLRGKWQGGGNIGSPVRDRAMYVDTLLSLQPDNPAIPAAVQQLADAKWQTTQDVAFASMAIGKYLRQVQTQKPYETGELILDDKSLAKGAAALSWKTPATSASRAAEHHLLASITGPTDSRGYLSWTRTGVPRAIPPSEDHGVTIRRRYLNEQGKPLQANQVQTGDLIFVELTIESSHALQNLVVEDLLPAGLEIENPRLQTTATHARKKAAQAPDLHSELYQARLDVRDDRMIIFGHLPENGLARHTYAARAVVPGVFALPPARVESMYDAGVRSLWGPGGRFEVKPLESKAIVDLPRGER